MVASCEAAGGARVRGIVYDFQCFAWEQLDRSQDAQIVAECPSATLGRMATLRLRMEARPTYLIEDKIRAAIGAARLAELGATDCHLDESALDPYRYPPVLSGWVNCERGGPYILISANGDVRNREDFFRWNNYPTAASSFSFGSTRYIPDRNNLRLFYFLPADAPEEVDFRVSMLIDKDARVFALVCAASHFEPAEYSRRAAACIDYANGFLSERTE